MGKIPVAGTQSLPSRGSFTAREIRDLEIGQRSGMGTLTAQ